MAKKTTKRIARRKRVTRQDRLIEQIAKSDMTGPAYEALVSELAFTAADNLLRKSPEAVSPSARKQRMTESIVRRYSDFLTRMGHRPRIEPGKRSTNIWFDAEGTRYVLTIDPSDAEFFWLMTMYGLGGLRLEGESVAERARDVNAMVKGVKVIPVPDDGLVRFSVETLLTRPPAGRAVLERAIELIRVGVHEFFKGASIAPVLNRARRGRQTRPRAKQRVRKQ